MRIGAVADSHGTGRGLCAVAVRLNIGWHSLQARISSSRLSIVRLIRPSFHESGRCSTTFMAAPRAKPEDGIRILLQIPQDGFTYSVRPCICAQKFRSAVVFWDFCLSRAVRCQKKDVTQAIDFHGANGPSRIHVSASPNLSCRERSRIRYVSNVPIQLGSMFSFLPFHVSPESDETSFPKTARTASSARHSPPA